MYNYTLGYHSVPTLFLVLAFLLSATFLTAQSANTAPTLREVPAEMTAQRHLLKTIYKEVKYPKVAREARRGGRYLLAIHVNEEGSSWEAMPLTELPEGAEPINLSVIATDDTQAAPVSGQMKVNADRALLEETERLGRFLVDIGFTPITQQGAIIADTLYLAFYYRLE
ncbi:hypothetical protein GGR28_002703 [Lewinella aquimaris]|uniref:Uncharacterized protein n=1 Tax=Neolewinella aquimaris TaxID=1835722 RepID=A0A840E823_9BACT|nr:hypothetical protein [Neolewinella aquimaris]MBB4080073.1 hypothetical protein [Neolewinella aquimaris]